MIAGFTMNSLELKIATSNAILEMADGLKSLCEQMKTVGQLHNTVSTDAKDDVTRREISIASFKDLKALLTELNSILGNNVRDPFSAESMGALREAIEIVRTVSSASTIVAVKADKLDDYDLVDLNHVEISNLNGGTVKLNGNVYENQMLLQIFNFALQFSKKNLERKHDEDSEICNEDLSEEGQSAAAKVIDVAVCLYKDAIYLSFSRLFDMGPTKCKIELKPLLPRDKADLLSIFALVAANSADFALDLSD